MNRDRRACFPAMVLLGLGVILATWLHNPVLILTCGILLLLVALFFVL